MFEDVSVLMPKKKVYVIKNSNKNTDAPDQVQSFRFYKEENMQNELR